EDLDLGLDSETAAAAARLPSWQDPSEGERKLAEALNTFDWSTVRELTESLIAQLAYDPSKFNDPSARRLLSRLRNKKRFGEMTRVAEAFLQAGTRGHQVRRQYAQALIDQGIFHAAELVLREILSDSAAPAQELDEAQGLLGRTFKQMYVSNKAPLNSI